MSTHLSQFWSGKTGYFAKGSDGWIYGVSHNRYNSIWLRAALESATRDTRAYEIRYLEGDRVRWVRGLDPVPAETQGAA